MIYRAPYFSRCRMIWLLHHPLLLSRYQAVSLSQSSCVSLVDQFSLTNSVLTYPVSMYNCTTLPFIQYFLPMTDIQYVHVNQMMKYFTSSLSSFDLCVFLPGRRGLWTWNSSSFTGSHCHISFQTNCSVMPCRANFTGFSTWWNKCSLVYRTQCKVLSAQPSVSFFSKSLLLLG
jgi:hypothetical protein